MNTTPIRNGRTSARWAGRALAASVLALLTTLAGLSVGAPTAQAAARQHTRPPGGSMFHVAGGTPYHVENSPRGIRMAARRGFDQIDLDLQMTKDGVIVATHWSQPMKMDGFVDPLHRLDRSRSVRSMTWSEVHRLRARGGYRIDRLESLIPLLKRHHLIGSLEVKGDPRFTSLSVMRQIKAWCDGSRVTAYIKEIPSLDRRHTQTLAAARAAGFWTRNAGVARQNWQAPTA